MQTEGQSEIPAKRKRTLHHKLTSKDNVDRDVVKRQRALSLQIAQQNSATEKNAAATLHATTKPSQQQAQATQQKTPSHQMPAETDSVDSNDSDAISEYPTVDASSILDELEDDSEIICVASDDEGEAESAGVQEIRDEEELGKFNERLGLPCGDELILPLARLQKDWRSPVYAFFQPEVIVSYIDGRRAHDFTCAAKHCKGRGKNPRLIRRYLDKGDKASTSGLKRHAECCWGKEIVVDAVNMKDLKAVRRSLKGATMKNGSITAVFERTGKGKVTYSHRQLTRTETR
jgi:hypothetical protein